MPETTVKTGYVNGSDMLVKAGGKCTGHATKHTLNLQSETKSHAVKPEASAPRSASLFSGKSVSGLSITINAEGLCHYAETENGFKAIAAEWVKGQSIEVECFERESDTEPYLKGMFVIVSISRDDPAQDDSSYTVQLENDGAPEIFDMTKISF